LNAVYLEIGCTADSVILRRQTGNIHPALFKFPLILANKSVNLFRFKISRDTAGKWELFADSTGGIILSKYGSFTDTNSIPSGWFGVFCKYTSSNSKKFCFDDFYAGRIVHDTLPPRITSIGFSDSLTIRIKFNEAIDSTTLNKEIKLSLINDPEKVVKAYISKDDPEILFVKINTDEKDFFCDTLRIRNISDLSNNFLMDTSIFICYYIPGICASGDLIINEVLFHPDARGSKFIEFYNRSSKAIDLSSLSIGSVGAGGVAMEAERLCIEERMLLPGDYYVISEDSANLCTRYYVPFHSKIAEVKDFPAMSADSGSLFLFSCKDSLTVDAMAYNSKMHLPFLSKTEGVSLERINAQMPSDDAATWQSASETSGYASPGYENSHYSYDQGKGVDLQLSSPIISPDNDGRDDLLYINMNSVEPGTLLSLRIYDLRGNPLKTITSQTTVSENSIFIWDGTGDNNRIVPMGYYIILSESISISGKHTSLKKAIAVVQKLY